MKKLIIGISILLLLSSLYGQNTESLLTIKNNFTVNNELHQPNSPANNFNKKSAGLAILYSMLLPGMGELYAGDYSTGKYFTIADGIIWGTFAGMTIHGNNKEDDFRAFAKSFGGVKLNGKDDEYFANIGIYENIEDYNTEKELNRDFDEVYLVDTHFWSWDGNSQRKSYRNLWTSSENAKNNVRFAVGALILNRIASAIFAVRAVSAHNKKESSKLSWNLNFGVQQSQTLPTRLVMNFNYGL